MGYLNTIGRDQIYHIRPSSFNWYDYPPNVSDRNFNKVYIYTFLSDNFDIWTGQLEFEPCGVLPIASGDLQDRPKISTHFLCLVFSFHILHKIQIYCERNRKYAFGFIYSRWPYSYPPVSWLYKSFRTWKRLFVPEPRWMSSVDILLLCCRRLLSKATCTSAASKRYMWSYLGRLELLGWRSSWK